jgi:hypothetical protein
MPVTMDVAIEHEKRRQRAIRVVALADFNRVRSVFVHRTDEVLVIDAWCNPPIEPAQSGQRILRALKRDFPGLPVALRLMDPEGRQTLWCGGRQ